MQTKTVHTKRVDRIHPATFQSRTLKTGLFVGNQQNLLGFPLLSGDELRKKHYSWRRSANM